jgi:hypothetical protein
MLCNASLIEFFITLLSWSILSILNDTSITNYWFSYLSIDIENSWDNT